jgi:hypothetical protein
MAANKIRPRLAFRVGVTGHRNLYPWTCRELRPRVRAKLEQIEHLAQQTATQARNYYDDDVPAILRAISPLAEGADRLFAEEALDLGYELECPLPFHCQEYRNDFRDEASKRQFDRLLARAGAVFELDGSREDAPAAYNLVGELVLDQCDMLLAIWDGNDAKGAGGTADVVAKTKERVPVVWLHTSPSEPDTIFTPDGGDDARQTQCEGIDERLKAIVWRLLLPPLDAGPAGSLNAIERLLAPVLSWSWRAFEGTLTIGVKRSKRPADAPPASHATFAFQEQYATWDSLASRLAGLYRGAFLSNYLLGVLAVFLAIAGNATRGNWKILPAGSHKLRMIRRSTNWIKALNFTRDPRRARPKGIAKLASKSCRNVYTCAQKGSYVSSWLSTDVRECFLRPSRGVGRPSRRPLPLLGSYLQQT